MKKNLFILAAAGGLLFTTAACKKNRSTDLELNFSGLENLGSDYVYEGWIIVDGEAVTTGTFTVNDAGAMSATTFEVNQKELEDASTFVLTIEPTVDSDPAPSAVHILAGDFSGDNASLNIAHEAALGTDFTSAEGTYILATPTDGGDMTDENSGVWFLDPTGGASAGLTLPALPAGWEYEGWAVVDGTPISTGRFTNASAADDAAPHNGTAASAPPFPGEDLLNNAPAGVSFPTDLAGKTVVISVEPAPDNSAAPFLLKPLVGNVSASATDHTPYTMSNNANATNPTGTATR